MRNPGKRLPLLALCILILSTGITSEAQETKTSEITAPETTAPHTSRAFSIAAALAIAGKFFQAGGTQFRTYFAHQRLDAMARSHATLNQRLLKATTSLQEPVDQLEHWQHVIGSSHTRHGFLAEKLEMAIRNAWANLKDDYQPVTADLPLNHPADSLLFGQPVQSKFYKNTLWSLEAIYNHLLRYAKHTSFRSGVFMIPQEQFEELQVIVNTPVRQLSPHQKLLRESLRESLKLAKVKELEDLIFPSLISRSQAEPVNLQTTLAQCQQQLEKEHHQAWRFILLRYGLDSFVAGATTHAIIYSGAEIVRYGLQLDNIQTTYAHRLYRIMNATLYGGVNGTMTFYLSTATGLPTPIGGAMSNIIMRIANASWQAFRGSADGQQTLPERALIAVGEESFSGLGASAFSGHLLGQMTGSITGVILWQSLLWWYDRHPPI